jgi:hypothetical protein
MPFKSKAQARFMFAKHPKIAKEFAAATPSIRKLPDRIHPKEAAADHPFKMNPSANQGGGCLTCGKPYGAHTIG